MLFSVPQLAIYGRATIHDFGQPKELTKMNFFKTHARTLISTGLTLASFFVAPHLQPLLMLASVAVSMAMVADAMMAKLASVAKMVRGTSTALVPVHAMDVKSLMNPAVIDSIGKMLVDAIHGPSQKLQTDSTVVAGVKAAVLKAVQAGEFPTLLIESIQPGMSELTRLATSAVLQHAVDKMTQAGQPAVTVGGSAQSRLTSILDPKA